MTLIRFAPADVFEEVRHEMEEMLNELRKKDGEAPKRNTSAPVWKPRVDVRESDEALWFAVEMPGMDKNDIHVSFEDGYLKIEGERKVAEQKDGLHYLRRERRYGKFGRRFKINTKVDHQKIEARYENGVLTVHLPKAPEEKPRKIEVKVNA